ncbi:MAG: hypothetical protein IME93_01280 [Proteobacteria bacterium]|nr:hypothetical protein [Pseudomonadota bacterium]
MTQRNGELENYLDGGSELSRAYAQQSDELPPESIDNAILAAARRETGSRPGNTLRRWQLPASMAAGLVLAVGMVSFLNQRIDGLDAGTPVDLAQSESATLQTQIAQLELPASAKAVEPSASEPATVREQTLAKAAAAADEQAVAVARKSLAAVSTEPAAKSATAGLSFNERFKRLRSGLKPSQVAVLLGEPSRKQDALWVYQRLTRTPGRTLEYRVSFSELKELKEWSRKEVLDNTTTNKP